MNALPFELFIKNCKSCSIETLPISVLSFQLIVQGEGESRSRRLWLRNTESTAFRKLHETLFSDKFLFQSLFCSFSEESYSALFLLASTKERIFML